MAQRPTEFTLWLEEALTSWILPVALLAAVAVVAGLYLLGVATEEQTAALAVAAVALGSAFLVARPGLSRTGADRTLAVAAAAATALVVLLSALPTVYPGRPLFEGQLSAEGDQLPLPPGAAGRIRLLVVGHLRKEGQGTASYVLGGAARPVEGKLERLYRSVRVGRSGRARVEADHTADWYDATIPEGATALTLRRVTGEMGGPLQVYGHRPLLPYPWPWVLSGLTLALAALAEARLAKKNMVAVPSGMALAFGLLVTANATPYAAVGPVMGALALGAAGGSLAGWAAGAIARRLLAARAAR